MPSLASSGLMAEWTDVPLSVVFVPTGSTVSGFRRLGTFVIVGRLDGRAIISYIAFIHRLDRHSAAPDTPPALNSRRFAIFFPVIIPIFLALLKKLKLTFIEDRAKIVGHSSCSFISVWKFDNDSSIRTRLKMTIYDFC